MTKSFARLFTLTACLAAVAPAFAQNEPTKVTATYSRLYAPGGFDSNDHVQIVGEGLFRNTCYRPAETKVLIDEKSRKIHVGPAAYEYSGFCLQVVLPFTRVIDVGILKPGKWQVLQGKEAELLGEINVRAAITNDADDFLYAPVTQAFFQQKGTSAEIFVAGEFQNSCMRLDDVMVTIEPEVLVLQPIAKMETGSTCRDGRFPFSKKIAVKILPAGRYLLHVRSMNSNSFNTLVQMK